jgi:hypothetical protein
MTGGRHLLPESSGAILMRPRNRHGGNNRCVPAAEWLAGELPRVARGLCHGQTTAPARAQIRSHL